MKGTVYFAAGDPTNGTELWKINGTAAGTVLVKDIVSGGSGSGPHAITNVNGSVYFAASNPTNGTELWQSNGTAASTVMVQDINPGTASSNPAWLTNLNGKLMFSANDGPHGVELWDPPPISVRTDDSHTSIKRVGIIDPAVALEERFPQTSKPPIDSEKVVNERSVRWMLDRLEHHRRQSRGSRTADSSRTSGTDLEMLADAVHVESLPRILTRVADAKTTRDLSDLRASAIESGLDADFLKDLAAVL